MKTAFVILAGLVIVSGQDDVVTTFVESNNKFAAAVYKILANGNPIENLLVSPFSAQIILGLAQSGARDDTASELQQSLRLPNASYFEAALQHFIPLLEENPIYHLHSANKIYVKDAYPINENFTSLAAHTFKSEAENIDFSSKEEAAHRMNQWVEHETMNKIHHLINPEILNNDTRLVLINALHLKANWTNRFPEYATKKRYFTHSLQGVFKQRVLVDTMHLQGEVLNYYDDSNLNATFLELPLEGDDIVMTIVLPKGELSELTEKMEEVLATHPFVQKSVNVALPKFKMMAKTDFKDILSLMGVKRAFEPGKADFSGIACKPGELYISHVAQKAFIDVNEDGIEAAAASYVVKVFNRMGFDATNFIVDRPFIFYVKIKGFVVFIGRVLLPKY